MPWWVGGSEGFASNINDVELGREERWVERRGELPAHAPRSRRARRLHKRKPAFLRHGGEDGSPGDKRPQGPGSQAPVASSGACCMTQREGAVAAQRVTAERAELRGHRGRRDGRPVLRAAATTILRAGAGVEQVQSRCCHVISRKSPSRRKAQHSTFNLSAHMRPCSRPPVDPPLEADLGLRGGARGDGSGGARAARGGVRVQGTDRDARRFGMRQPSVLGEQQPIDPDHQKREELEVSGNQAENEGPPAKTARRRALQQPAGGVFVAILCSWWRMAGHCCSFQLLLTGCLASHLPVASVLSWSSCRFQHSPRLVQYEAGRRRLESRS